MKPLNLSLKNLAKQGLQVNSYGTILERGRDGTAFSCKVKTLIRHYNSARKESVKEQCRKELEKCGVKIFTEEEIEDMKKYIKNKTGDLLGYSNCLHCGDRWNWKSYHCTRFNDSESMFPLCEECFQELPYREVLKYYHKLIQQWECDYGKSLSTAEIECFEKNIRRGKENTREL